MKVLILANIGLGLYKFRRELLEELVKDNEVYFCIPYDNFVDPIKQIGCKYIENNLLDRHGTNPVKELKLISFYKKVLKDLKPDIVFTYTIKCNAYGGMACAKLGIPYVVNVTGLGTAIENGGFMQKISLALYKRGLNKAQKVFFQNCENRDFMISQGVVKGAYDVLPGSGVNLTQYKLLPYPDGDTVDFVFIARVMKEKGIDQYIDAAIEIRKRFPESRFHICGFCEQNYEEKLSELNKNHTIIYHGLVSDMIPIYKMSACTVHPTYYPEGLSNVLLESSASGRPIITTDRAGCREVIEDGINGFVVKQQDSFDLIDKIDKFMRLNKADRALMGVRGREKVKNEFDRNIVISKYLDEMRKVSNNGL